ncbi:MAG: histidine kinase [Bacteroidales bacterium]|nr:histidine kinase [Bacteroidales bacterium]MDD4602501.1 histidine kinase [Bacteroidales bacterium]
MNKKHFTLLLHLLVWIMLFSMPYMLSLSQSINIQMLLERSWIPLLYYALIFYLNYFLLIDRLFFQKKFVVYAIVNVAIIAVLIWLNLELKSHFFMHYELNRPQGNPPPKNLFIYTDLISLLVPLAFAIALKISERWIKTEAERKEAANVKLQSELQHLKYQLQPHFFFNSLNNIYSLVDISPEQAKNTIHSLSKLMRYLLYDTNAELVSLAREVDFMQKYIALMKLRTSEKTVIHVDFSPVKENIMIAPLLFISLIENAFKYGVSASAPSDIYFTLKHNDDQIYFETKNRKYPKSHSDIVDSGIGLLNLKKRLALLYPENYTFSAEVMNENFVTSLTIRYTHVPNQKPSHA